MIEQRKAPKEISYAFAVEPTSLLVAGAKQNIFCAFQQELVQLASEPYVLVTTSLSSSANFLCWYVNCTVGS